MHWKPATKLVLGLAATVSAHANEIVINMDESIRQLPDCGGTFESRSDNVDDEGRQYVRVRLSHIAHCQRYSVLHQDVVIGPEFDERPIRQGKITEFKLYARQLPKRANHVTIYIHGYRNQEQRSDTVTFIFRETPDPESQSLVPPIARPNPSPSSKTGSKTPSTKRTSVFIPPPPLMPWAPILRWWINN